VAQSRLSEQITGKPYEALERLERRYTTCRRLVALAG
jgi:hypothetical protein